MELKHIHLSNLAVSTANMCGKGRAEIDINLPSVRGRSVLKPLIVRAIGSPHTFEIVAGKRRYAAWAVAEEMGRRRALPCALLDKSDDATALEASLLIENIARLDFTMRGKGRRSSSELL